MLSLYLLSGDYHVLADISKVVSRFQARDLWQKKVGRRQGAARNNDNQPGKEGSRDGNIYVDSIDYTQQSI